MSPRFALNPRWLWAGIALLAALLLVIFVGGFNLPLFYWGNSLSLYTGEWIWSNITLFGDTLIIFAILLPLINRRPELIWSLLLAAIVVSIEVRLGKELIPSPRPAGILPMEELNLIGYVASHGSFPSGHTAAAFTLAAIVALLPNISLSWKIAAVMMAALVALSRIVVGIHWPLDVLGGALAGWVGAAIGCYLAARLPFGMGLKAQRIQAGFLVLIALPTIAMHDGGYPQGRILIIVLTLTMLLMAIPGIRQLFSKPSTESEPQH